MGLAERLKRKLHAEQALAPVQVRDDRGRVLAEGDEVILLEPGSTWRIASITRILDPGAPPNLLRVKLVSVRELVLECGTAINGLVRVRTALELELPKAMKEAQKADETPPQ